MSRKEKYIIEVKDIINTIIDYFTFSQWGRHG